MASILLIWFVIFLISLIYKLLIRGFFNNRRSGPSASTWEVKTQTGNKNNPIREETGPFVETVQDPVCGVYFPELEAVSRLVSGQKMLFCSEKCAAKYAADHPAIRPEAHAFTV